MKILFISLFGSMLLFSCSGLPKVKFSWVPEDMPEAGDTISFMNESKRAEAFQWEFGDGGVSHSPSPQYVYQKSGIFDVLLNATNDQGSNLGVETITIHDPTVLSFVVYDSTKYNLLEGAAVWVYDNESDRDSLLQARYEGTTDSLGTVSFRNVEPIVYHVWVEQEAGDGSWNFKGYTNAVQQNKVNIYEVPCTWRTTSMMVPSTHFMAATIRSSR